MAYEFTFTPRFQKHFKGLTVQEKKQLKNKLELLAENPSHPSLRTKRIQGTTDLFECSVNMDIRISGAAIPSPAPAHRGSARFSGRPFRIVPLPPIFQCLPPPSCRPGIPC